MTTITGRAGDAMKKIPEDLVSLVLEETNLETGAIPTQQNFEVPESCSRCGGLMVITDCFDVLSDTAEIDCTAYRCVQCGDLVDPVILRNRNNRPELTPKKKNLWLNSHDYVGHRYLPLQSYPIRLLAICFSPSSAPPRCYSIARRRWSQSSHLTVGIKPT